MPFQRGFSVQSFCSSWAICLRALISISRGEIGFRWRNTIGELRCSKAYNLYKTLLFNPIFQCVMDLISSFEMLFHIGKTSLRQSTTDISLCETPSAMR
jgi:hypothetical protein